MAKGLALLTWDHQVLLEAEFSYDCMALYCTEPFIITLPSSRYDLNYMERDMTHQTIVLFLHENICGHSSEAPNRDASMSTHNICFHREIRKVFPQHLLSRAMLDIPLSRSVHTGDRFLAILTRLITFMTSYLLFCTSISL